MSFGNVWAQIRYTNHQLRYAAALRPHDASRGPETPKLAHDERQISSSPGPTTTNDCCSLRNSVLDFIPQHSGYLSKSTISFLEIGRSEESM